VIQTERAFIGFCGELCLASKVQAYLTPNPLPIGPVLRSTAEGGWGEGENQREQPARAHTFIVEHTTGDFYKAAETPAPKKQLPRMHEPTNLASRLLQFQSEMVAGDVHAVGQIEPMRGEALNPRIQTQTVAIGFFSPLNEPVKKEAAMAFRAAGLIGNQIVHIQKTSGIKALVDSVTGQARHAAAGFEENESVTLIARLPLHAPHKLGFNQVRPELHHHGKAAQDFGVGIGKSNPGHGLELNR
jgi:hypothetical protein